MKKVILTCLCAAFLNSAFAQSYKETFDSNSLEWTERAYKNGDGNAVIKDGKMYLSSMETKYFQSNSFVRNVSYTNFETHCYAPIDVTKPFKITAKTFSKGIKDGRLVGMVINYKDDGNYYVFAIDEDAIYFMRYENNAYVGGVTQGLKWESKKTNVQIWELESNGSTLTFLLNGAPMLNIRYMPLVYSGFGFLTRGATTLTIDEVEFTQLR